MENPLARLLRIMVTGIRLVLLTLSFVGWIVFVVGFVRLDKRVHSYYMDPANNPFGLPSITAHFLGLAKILFIPMWVFVSSGLVVYISLALHIIVTHQNIRHILHSLFMFFNIFYMFGGSGSLIITLAFSSPKTSQFLQGLVHLDRSASMLALYGVSISVGTYWISTWLWPLFELKRRRRTTFAYQPVPREDIDDAIIAGAHIQGPRYANGSGKFTNSVTRELCQQVSQEYGEYNYD